jgi:hypothetical protein
MGGASKDVVDAAVPEALMVAASDGRGRVMEVEDGGGWAVLRNRRPGRGTIGRTRRGGKITGCGVLLLTMLVMQLQRGRCSRSAWREVFRQGALTLLGVTCCPSIRILGRGMCGGDKGGVVAGWWLLGILGVDRKA